MSSKRLKNRLITNSFTYDEHSWPIRAGCIKQAGWKKIKNFLCEQVLIRASRLEKSQKNSLRACSRNKNTRVYAFKVLLKTSLMLSEDSNDRWSIFFWRAKLDSKLGELVLGALLLLLLKEASRSVTLCIWVLCPLCLKVIGHRSAAPGGSQAPPSA